MKAIGYRQSLPIDHPDALLDLELPTPEATGRPWSSVPSHCTRCGPAS